jgi:peroxiredoxin Q/BCP
MVSIPDPAVPHVVAAGDPAPAFDLPTSSGGRVTLAGLIGAPFVLYFYPKADTSGCTRQACEFQDALAARALAGINPVVPVIGVSRDPLKAIAAFGAKFGLGFPLASDLEGTVIAAYGSWVEKSMYGRKYMGIDRSTFLINRDGRIARDWRKVKVPGHAADVLAAAHAL